MGFRILRDLCTKRTTILAYFSPVIHDSGVLTLIWDQAVGAHAGAHELPHPTPPPTPDAAGMRNDVAMTSTAQHDTAVENTPETEMRRIPSDHNLARWRGEHPAAQETPTRSRNITSTAETKARWRSEHPASVEATSPLRATPSVARPMPAYSNKHYYKMCVQMYAKIYHSYTHLILALGIVRKPTVWGFMTTKCSCIHDIGRAT